MLYDHAPCGLILTRPDGLIERANATFCQWAGFESRALVGTRRFQDLLTAGGRIFHQTHFAPLLQMQGSVSELKLDLITADGLTIPIMVNASRHEQDGVAWHMLAVFVSKERHAYERELLASRRHAERLAESQGQIQGELREADRRKDEFLAMLAHELRNPLAPIASSAQLLRLASENPAQVREAAAVIERQIGHLTNLVNDLLDVSRVTRGQIDLRLEPLDLAGIISAAIEQSRPLIDGKGQSLALDLEPGLFVEGDRTRLVQIFVNLLNNAAKYTPQGGHVAVSLHAENSGVRVDVVDSGIGIDSSLLPSVFELFSQAERTPDRSQGGLGIGLALVRSLVSLHSGHVEAHSDGPHFGSRFTVRLPITDCVDTVTPPSPAAPAPSSRLARVLIVDDNADAASTLADVVRLAGHAVDIATSAHEALAHLHDGRPVPTACILDIGLPDMTGYELGARIREAMAEAPPILIALTGYGQAQDRVMTKAAGFDHHLVKPADPDELLSLLVPPEAAIESTRG